MKTRGLLIAITIILVFMAGLGVGDLLATLRHQSVILRLEGETVILRNEIDRYIDAIRQIRSAASQAMPMEKAQ